MKGSIMELNVTTTRVRTGLFGRGYTVTIVARDIVGGEFTATAQGKDITEVTNRALSLLHLTIQLSK